MKFARTVLTALAALTLPAAAQAVVIDFDDLGNGVVVTNQYAGVTFSSDPGAQILTTAQSLGSSLPNFICSGIGGSINCVNSVFVDFATGVSGLSFLQVGDNTFGDVGDVRVFSGAALLGTVDIFADNQFSVANLVDLSAFSNITRIEIVNISDPGGLGFDDFTFTVGGSGAVPEPATWAMMIGGFALVGASMRRRRTAVSFA
jgi:hypothetical protein